MLQPRTVQHQSLCCHQTVVMHLRQQVPIGSLYSATEVWTSSSKLQDVVPYDEFDEFMDNLPDKPPPTKSCPQKPLTPEDLEFLTSLEEPVDHTPPPPPPPVNRSLRSVHRMRKFPRFKSDDTRQQAMRKHMGEYKVRYLEKQKRKKRRQKKQE